MTWVICARVSSSQDRSTILSTASRKMSTAALTMKMQITTLATLSITGKPAREQAIPTRAPMEERLSDR